ncbi:hypothetical protein OCS_03361 [Ophiocordyceps sinensis CO18]|uniref:Uncharacterized protein n=1 Tax=Ophiocordyceps sinensis (strain Co18 / CGMCC 3.14243) TaxID=911162 RepID=T5A632_OPHSC|nr:hypothetical protein OCS_03361 [Ophiocordyceps sinensis CO18]
MCRKVTCATCEKTSWFGCGSHIAAVMDAVPAADRCTCEPAVEVGGKAYPPMVKTFPPMVEQLGS